MFGLIYLFFTNPSGFCLFVARRSRSLSQRRGFPFRSSNSRSRSHSGKRKRSFSPRKHSHPRTSSRRRSRSSKKSHRRSRSPRKATIRSRSPVRKSTRGSAKRSRSHSTSSSNQTATSLASQSTASCTGPQERCRALLEQLGSASMQADSNDRITNVLACFHEDLRILNLDSGSVITQGIKKLRERYSKVGPALKVAPVRHVFIWHPSEPEIGFSLVFYAPNCSPCMGPRGIGPNTSAVSVLYRVKQRLLSHVWVCVDADGYSSEADQSPSQLQQSRLWAQVIEVVQDSLGLGATFSFVAGSAAWS
jgi:hypothetical protein